MFTVLTDPSAFLALAPFVQLVALLLAAGAVVGALWLAYQLLCLIASAF